MLYYLHADDTSNLVKFSGRRRAFTITIWRLEYEMIDMGNGMHELERGSYSAVVPLALRFLRRHNAGFGTNYTC